MSSFRFQRNRGLRRSESGHSPKDKVVNGMLLPRKDGHSSAKSTLGSAVPMEIRSRHTRNRKRPLAARMEGATSLSRTPGWTCSSRERTINRTCTAAASALTTAAMHTMWPVTRGSTQGRGPSTAVSATRLFHTGLTYERTKRCTQVKNRSGVSFVSERLCRTFT